MKSFMVVGGFGFVGSRVARELHRLGCDVTVLDLCEPYPGTGEAQDDYDRRTASRWDGLRNIPVHRVDITDPVAVEEAVSSTQPDVVIHLASVPIAGLASADPVWTAKQMVLGTTHLLDACEASGVERFVYVSSSMVYGDFESGLATEAHPTRCTSMYGTLKLASERLAIAYQERSAMDAVIVRPMAVYGPTGNEQFVVTRFVRAALECRPVKVFGADTCLDFTYVDDVAHGIVLAALAREAAGEVFNLAAGRPRRLVEVVEILEQLVGPIDHELLPPQGDYPRRGGMDISKARRLLGFEPTVSLEEGLGGMVDAFARAGTSTLPAARPVLSNASG